MKRVLGSIRRADERYHMIEDGDRICIGVSGGKDSLLLMEALKLYQNFSRTKFEVCAVSLDLGIVEQDWESIKAFAARIGIDYTALKTDIGEVVYDKQTACSSISIPAQERNTADLLGERQKETLGSNWVYAEDMLPRPKMNGLENSGMAVLYATPVILADGDNLNSVTKDFRVSLGNDQNTKVAWKASRGLVEILTDGTARIKGGGTEILTASYKNVSRDIQIVIKGTDSIDDINVGSEEGDNLWRNLNGQVVATPTHGIYIRNGKKIIVR